MKLENNVRKAMDASRARKLADHIFIRVQEAESKNVSLSGEQSWALSSQSLFLVTCYLR